MGSNESDRSDEVLVEVRMFAGCATREIHRRIAESEEPFLDLTSGHTVDVPSATYWNQPILPYPTKKYKPLETCDLFNFGTKRFRNRAMQTVLALFRRPPVYQHSNMVEHPVHYSAPIFGMHHCNASAGSEAL